ncbi:hypothetical protein ACOKM5_04805 [Streptomyces sp. BH097]|uniref:hypothetical protein n=1 Tax=unclassified Streptomyces TaxID=2593676 RepID=UPI003BB70282
MGSAGQPRAQAGHSHLFPGARVRVRGLDAPAAHLDTPQPMTFVVTFADGEEAAAEVLVPGDGRQDSTVLAVEAHTSRAGTELPAQSWMIKEYLLDGAALVLRLGVRLT